jgi:hypothetical protein
MGDPSSASLASANVEIRMEFFPGMAPSRPAVKVST